MGKTRGRGEGVAVLEHLGERVCPVCGRVATFTARLRYKYAGISGLCAWVAGREYGAECDLCGVRMVLDLRESRNYWPKDNIPFARKWSWALFLAILLVSAACVTSWLTLWGSGSAVLLASPQRHDLYIVDLAAIPESGFTESNDGDAREHAYGVMKLISVDKDEFIFATSTTAFTHPSGVIDMLDRSPYLLNFDAQNLLAFDKKDLQHMWELKVIHEIRRQ